MTMVLMQPPPSFFAPQPARRARNRLRMFTPLHRSTASSARAGPGLNHEHSLPHVHHVVFRAVMHLHGMQAICELRGRTQQQLLPHLGQAQVAQPQWLKVALVQLTARLRGAASSGTTIAP